MSLERLTTTKLAELEGLEMVVSFPRPPARPPPPPSKPASSLALGQPVCPFGMAEHAPGWPAPIFSECFTGEVSEWDKG